MIYKGDMPEVEILKKEKKLAEANFEMIMELIIHTQIERVIIAESMHRLNKIDRELLKLNAIDR